jgi:hypothetical protein
MYADLSRHEAEEVSLFGLRAELTCWAGTQMSARGGTWMHVSAICKRHMAIEVFVKSTAPSSAAWLLRTSYEKPSCALKREL